MKRILRVFAVLSATAMISALTVSGASANTVNPAVTGQPNTSAQLASNCSFSEGQACYLLNLAGFYAAGDIHGNTVGTDAVNGTRYVFRVAEIVGGITYGYISNANDTLCWNYISGPNEIVMDSCQSGDHNELYAMVPCTDGSWCIDTFDRGGSYKLYGNINNSPLFFFAAVNKYSEWEALSSI